MTVHVGCYTASPVACHPPDRQLGDTTGSPTRVTPAARSSASAASTVGRATPAVRSSSTDVTNPSRFASIAVARTQWSVAMPTTSTSVTERARSQDARSTPDDAPWKPEYAAEYSPLVNTASTRETSSDGWRSTPPVPTTQCTGQVDT